MPTDLWCKMEAVLMAENDTIDLRMRGGQVRNIGAGLAAAHHHHEPAAVKLLSRLELRRMYNHWRVADPTDVWQIRFHVQPGTYGHGIAFPSLRAFLCPILDDVAAPAPPRDRGDSRA